MHFSDTMLRPSSVRARRPEVHVVRSALCPRSDSLFVVVRRVFLDCLINPLQEQMEEWKRGANTLDKDHAKGTQTDTLKDDTTR